MWSRVDRVPLCIVRRFILSARRLSAVARGGGLWPVRVWPRARGGQHIWLPAFLGSARVILTESERAGSTRFRLGRVAMASAVCGDVVVFVVGSFYLLRRVCDLPAELLIVCESSM